MVLCSRGSKQSRCNAIQASALSSSGKPSTLSSELDYWFYEVHKRFWPKHTASSYLNLVSKSAKVRPNFQTYVTKVWHPAEVRNKKLIQMFRPSKVPAHVRLIEKSDAGKLRQRLSTYAPNDLKLRNHFHSLLFQEIAPHHANHYTVLYIHEKPALAQPQEHSIWSRTSVTIPLLNPFH